MIIDDLHILDIENNGYHRIMATLQEYIMIKKRYSIH